MFFEICNETIFGVIKANICDFWCKTFCSLFRPVNLIEIIRNIKLCNSAKFLWVLSSKTDFDIVPIHFVFWVVIFVEVDWEICEHAYPRIALVLELWQILLSLITANKWSSNICEQKFVGDRSIEDNILITDNWRNKVKKDKS